MRGPRSWRPSDSMPCVTKRALPTIRCRTFGWEGPTSSSTRALTAAGAMCSHAKTYPSTRTPRPALTRHFASGSNTDVTPSISDSRPLPMCRSAVFSGRVSERSVRMIGGGEMPVAFVCMSMRSGIGQCCAMVGVRYDALSRRVWRPARFNSFERRARVSDGFVVGHRGAASEQYGDAVVAEAFIQGGKCLVASLAEPREWWNEDGVGRTQEERCVFVASGTGEHARDADEGRGETVAVPGARRDVHCTQVGLQRRLFIPEKVVAPGKSCLRDADGLLVADGRSDLYCFFEYGNRLHRVEFGQVQSEHGECRRESRRAGELPGFGDAFLHRRARGAFAGSGDGSGRHGDESQDRFVSLAGGAR